MRSPREVKDKIRQIQFEHLKKVYEEKLAKEPENCTYNREIKVRGQEEVATRVCVYFSTNNHFEVCNTSECSQSCNAFIPKRDKKELRKNLEDDVEAHPQKYPEILVLKWALEDRSKLSFGFGFFSTILLRIKNFFRWRR